MNELDERTMETTTNLISLLGEQVQTGENNALDLSTLSASETQEIISTLVRKVWTRRTGFLKTGNRLTSKLLELTADKLEAGERDTLVLPAENLQKALLPTEEAPDNSSNDKEMYQRADSLTSGRTSSRMQHAQQILRDVEQEALDKV